MRAAMSARNRRPVSIRARPDETAAPSQIPRNARMVTLTASREGAESLRALCLDSRSVLSINAVPLQLLFEAAARNSG
jgi:hypothetical protein